MSKDLTSEFTKTMGEQTGSAKTHLDSAIVPHPPITRPSTAKPASSTKYSPKISPISSQRWQTSRKR